MKHSKSENLQSVRSELHWEQRRRPRWIFDSIFAFGFLILGIWFIATVQLNLLSVLVIATAISIRRLFPGIALTLAWLAAFMQMAFGVVPGYPELGILVVLYSSSAYGMSRVRQASGISVVAGTILATLYLTGPTSGIPIWQFEKYESGLSFNDDLREITMFFVVFLLALVATWLAGLLRRNVLLRQQQSRAQTLAEVEMIAEQERTRIARDMHDVVAHTLTVIVAQADGARYLVGKDKHATKQTEKALETIATTSRDALAQVRILLAELRHRQEPGPQPDLAQLDELLNQFRFAGLALQLNGNFDLTLELSPDRQRALYRILQEALTNALRHGDTTQPIELFCRTGINQIRVGIRNQIHESKGPIHQGHGLIGMTERAMLVGATLSSTATAHTFDVEILFPFAEGTNRQQRTNND